MKNVSFAAEDRPALQVKQITLVGVMTAIICLLGPLSFVTTVSPVPISLGTLAIYFVLTVLGRRLGTWSVMIYLLIGLVGLPVFTGFTGGPGKLLGPTGGYLIGYIFLALISGTFFDKWDGKVLPCVLGMILGTAALYLFGSLWLSYQASYTLPQAFMAGAIPYIPGDSAKIALAIVIGRQVKKRLQKAGLA